MIISPLCSSSTLIPLILYQNTIKFLLNQLNVTIFNPHIIYPSITNVWPLLLTPLPSSFRLIASHPIKTRSNSSKTLLIPIILSSHRLSLISNIWPSSFTLIAFLPKKKIRWNSSWAHLHHFIFLSFITQLAKSGHDYKPFTFLVYVNCFSSYQNMLKFLLHQLCYFYTPITYRSITNVWPQLLALYVLHPRYINLVLSKHFPVSPEPT